MKEEKDGVELEISDEAVKKRKKASKGVHKKKKATKKMTTSEIRAKREEKLKKMEVENYTIKEKDNDKTFYIYAIIIAVIFCIISFYLIFNFTYGKSDVTEVPINITDIEPSIENSNEHELDDQLVSDYAEIQGYVTGINEEYKTIEVLDIDDGSTVSVVFSNTTAITDEYGRALVFSEIELGDGVEVKYVKANNVAVTIDMPSNFFTKANKTNVITNSASNSLEYNGTNYYITDYTLIFDTAGNKINLSEIDKSDYVTFKGVDNYVNYIQVIKGHGNLRFTNIGSVKNPKAEINTKTILDLEKTNEITLAEGEYKVIVSGDNITPYLQYVTIEPSKDVEINLSHTSDKLGNVYVITNTTGIVLKIDDKEYDENKAITLPYGEYAMEASKLNYKSDIQSVVIDKPTTNVTFNLVPIETNVVLDIESTPSGAEVYIDNQLAGVTPLKIAVAEGGHNVKLKYTNKHDINFDIDGEEAYYKYNFTMVDKPEDTEDTEETDDTSDDTSEDTSE